MRAQDGMSTDVGRPGCPHPDRFGRHHGHRAADRTNRPGRWRLRAASRRSRVRRRRQRDDDLAGLYWKLSEREIFPHYAGIGIPIMMYNNPATSGIDMNPQLLVQMFETADNVAMVKSPPATFPGCGASTTSAAGYCRSTRAVARRVRAGAAGSCAAAPCLGPPPCIDLYDAVGWGRIAKSTSHLR